MRAVIFGQMQAKDSTIKLSEYIGSLLNCDKLYISETNEDRKLLFELPKLYGSWIIFSVQEHSTPSSYPWTFSLKKYALIVSISEKGSIGTPQSQCVVQPGISFFKRRRSLQLLSRCLAHIIGFRVFLYLNEKLMDNSGSFVNAH